MRNPITIANPAPSRNGSVVRASTSPSWVVPATKSGIGRRWWYFLAMISAWVFMPEIRRLANWKSGFHAIDVLSIVPLLLIVPLTFAFLGERQKSVDKRVFAIILAWASVFVYSLIIGLSNGQRSSALYSFALFVLPAVAGLWVASDSVPVTVAARRIAITYAALAALVSVYGIVQYVAIPEWDALWMRNANMDSIGIPAPYMVRVFSTLNAPGPCAEFLTCSIFLSLFAMRGRAAWWISLALSLTFVTLTLTMVRGAWLAIPAGFLVYGFFTPARKRFITSAAVAVAVIATALAVAPLVGASSWDEIFIARLSTFTNLSSDVSAQSRATQIQGVLPDAIETPLGLGLGVFGTAAKLNSELARTADFDGGLVGRFVEMGYVGFAGYLLTLLAALALTVRAWWCATILQNRAVAQIAAISAALQTAILVLDLDGDAHVAFTGVSFWIALGLCLHRDTALTLPRFRRANHFNLASKQRLSTPGRRSLSSSE